MLFKRVNMKFVMEDYIVFNHKVHKEKIIKSRLERALCPWWKILVPFVVK